MIINVFNEIFKVDEFGGIGTEIIVNGLFIPDVDKYFMENTKFRILKNIK